MKYNMGSKLWEDVNEGDVLPELDWGLMTPKRYFLMYQGTRDPNPQHHDTEYNRAGGSRDYYATTPWYQALFARFVTDWTGPESDFRATSHRLEIQVCPGDRVVVSGQVTRKYEEDGDHRVDVEIVSTSNMGCNAIATATMAMPSRADGPVTPVKTAVLSASTPNPLMPDWAKEEVAKGASPRVNALAVPVSEAQIIYWCDMVRCANPLYFDTDYARNSRHKGMIAPPPSMLVWQFGRPEQTRDESNPEWTAWPEMNDGAADGTSNKRTVPGATFSLAASSRQVYGAVLRPGDALTKSEQFIGATPLKKTHLGWGHFTTLATTYYNQRDEVVSIAENTSFNWGLPEKQVKATVEKQGAAG